MTQGNQEGRIILANKPLYWSSFEVVNYFKRQVKPLKIGHAGTLDPLASGLLILCTGKLTKQISQIQDQFKVYEGTLLLGATTASYDRETPAIASGSFGHLSETDFKSATLAFTGTIMQTPPLFSAVKVEGVRGYELGREGKEVELRAKPVTIYEFELSRIALPQIDFRIQCSKGTYIRSLVHDFGQALGCGAYMSRLVRTQVGDYKLADATFELDALTTTKSRILSEKVLGFYPAD